METPGQYKLAKGKVLVVHFRPRMRTSPDPQPYSSGSRNGGSRKVRKGRVTLRLLKRVALEGNGHAQFGLYLAYIKGYGVKENPRVARFWLLHAARSLYVPALRSVYCYFKCGSEKRGIPKDLLWAERYLIVWRLVGARKRAPSSERRRFDRRLINVVHLLPVVDGDTPLYKLPR